MAQSRRTFIGGLGASVLAIRINPMQALGIAADRFARFREAKFGMFIHWGPYSVAGVEASWPILRPSGEITEAEYRSLPQRFNPVKFDPHEWVDLAKSAGQRYMVFTTKHHDGFCMFDSAYTSYKISRTPYGKDVVKMLSDACHEQKMPLGLYYSPPDMNHPAFRDTSKLSATNYRGEPERAEWPMYLEYMSLQLDELLTKYGPVAELWFDSVDWKVQHQYDGRRFMEQIHQLQPATLVNDRIGVPGDFVTPEQYVPTRVLTRGTQLHDVEHVQASQQDNAVPRADDFQPWESCMTINHTWAYRSKDREFKSVDTLIRSLIEVVSRGGNFLLDVGPQPDGQIQPEFVERLQSMGKWVLKNAAAIYGSSYGPIQGEPRFRTTSRGASTYVFVMDDSAKEISLPGPHKLSGQVRLASTEKPLPFSNTAHGVSIPVTRELWSDGIPVIEVRG